MRTWWITYRQVNRAMGKTGSVPVYKAPVINTSINWYNSPIGVRGKYFMECPCCGEEITTGNKCKKCGKGNLPSKEMEVQYKEFKVSELLEIRMPSPAPQGEGMKNPEPAPASEDGSIRTGKAEEKPAAKKSHIFMFAIIALLAALAGFCLLKFLF
jgi:hypothetical protein